MSGRRDGFVSSCSGVSKAMPPIRIETSDSVSIFTPLALTDTSMPLAFQKRLLGVDALVERGPHEDPRRHEVVRVGSSADETTRPTSMRRKKTGEPTLIAPAPRASAARRSGRTPRVVTIGRLVEADEASGCACPRAPDRLRCRRPDSSVVSPDT